MTAVATFEWSLWPVLIVAFPLAGAALLAFLGRRLARRAVAWIGVLAVGAAFVASLITLAGYQAARAGGHDGIRVVLWPFWETSAGAGAAAGELLGPAGPVNGSIPVGLLADGLSVWFALIVTGVGLLIHVYSAGYMAGDGSFARYFAELNYFIFAMSLLVLGDGLLPMLLGWGGVGLASYLLIGFWHARPDARAASIKAFVVTLTGELGIVLAAALLLAETGQLEFHGMFAALGGVPETALTAAGLLLLWGAAAKSAQLPLHVWLPDAMAGPTPVSALIHAATMVTAGVYLTARMYPVYLAAPAAGSAVAWVGALSALFGALVACGQTDVKRVLAYSTMSQVGYMFLGVGLQAQEAGVFHFFTQAFFKALLFLAAGLVIHHLGGEQDMRRMGGLGRHLGLAYAAYGVGVLARVGVPPFSGYYSKEAIIEAAWERGQTALWAISVVSVLLTALYSFRMLALVFTGPARRPQPAGGRAEATGHGPEGGERAAIRRAMEIPVAVLAVLAITGGWAGMPGRPNWVSAVLSPFFERYREAAAGTAVHAQAPVPFVAWVPLLMAAVGALAAACVYGPGRREGLSRWAAPAWMAQAFDRGLYVDDAYRLVFARGVRALSRLIDSRAERELIDGSVNGVATLAATASRLFARIQDGIVRRYALILVGATAAIVAWVVFASFAV